MSLKLFPFFFAFLTLFLFFFVTREFELSLLCEIVMAEVPFFAFNSQDKENSPTAFFMKGHFHDKWN